MALNTNENQHLWSQIETREQPIQVVMLGASNLSRSFPLAVETAYQTLTRPIAIHAAMGFGRSYGIESGFLGKKFSGISFSKIWEALESETSSSTIAFVTDVGNDLGYEQPVDAIMEWVEACVSRLQERGTQVALTDVPIGALRRVSQAKFTLLRSLFFPSCRLSWSELLTRAEQLSARLGELANSQKMPIFPVPNGWYGFDPIHPRSAHLRDYWNKLFALLAVREGVTAQRRLSWRSYWRLRTLTSPSLGQKVSPGQFSARRALLCERTSVALY